MKKLDELEAAVLRSSASCPEYSPHEIIALIACIRDLREHHYGGSEVADEIIAEHLGETSIDDDKC